MPTFCDNYFFRQHFYTYIYSYSFFSNAKKNYLEHPNPNHANIMRFASTEVDFVKVKII